MGAPVSILMPRGRKFLVGMAANDFLGPNKLLARRKNLLHGGDDNPNGNACSDKGIENRIPGYAAKETGGDWRQGHVHVADIVDVRQPHCRVAAARREQQPGHTCVSSQLGPRTRIPAKLANMEWFSRLLS